MAQTAIPVQLIADALRGMGAAATVNTTGSFGYRLDGKVVGALIGVPEYDFQTQVVLTAIGTEHLVPADKVSAIAALREQKRTLKGAAARQAGAALRALLDKVVGAL